MAKDTLPAPTAPDVVGEWSTQPLLAARRALNSSRIMALAVLAIFEKGELYDLAATDGDQTFALLVAAETCLKELANESQAGMAAIEMAEAVDRAAAASGKPAQRNGADHV